LVSNFEVLRTRVQVANLKPTILRLRTVLAISKSTLAQLLGSLGSEPVEVDGRIRTDLETWALLPDLQARAQAERLELKNLDRNLRMARIGEGLAAWSNLPNLALTGAWTYYDTQDQNFPPRVSYLKHSWEIAVGVSWPFWDNLAAIPKAQGAAAKGREIELARATLEDGIRLEVEAAYLTLHAALEAFQAQKQAVELARESFKMSETQYRAGQATNLDVLDARVALNQSELSLLQAGYEYLLANVKLHQAIGDRF
jgi:outer membrane protein